MTAPAPFNPARARRTLFGALIDARRDFGATKSIVVDGDGRTLTYEDLVRAALALGHALQAGTAKGEFVGVLLPTGIGALIAVLGLSAYGLVPAMLNFTAGQPSIQAALKAAKISRIVTAHRFIELGKFEAMECWLQPLAKLVYLEEVRAKISVRDKAAAFIGTHMPALIASKPSPDTPAVILFTSGTEGEPKGVVLSHANILSNVEQVRAHVQFLDTDIVFNPLPAFHSFGLTVGSLMPLYLGVKTVFHPTPRQPHEIVRRIKDTGATILLATDTFVSQYARAATDGDLDTLRLAVCGAERLRDETRALVHRKYGVELLEGYGVTEAAPVIAANQPGANRAGTVGHLMPGMEQRLEPVEGITNAGRLYVRGPNIMLGYLVSANPGVVTPPQGGWHDTGDVVSVDEDGYLAIRGRLKRFAKIGGEAVSLTVVENCASALWPDHTHAAVTLPDGRKGEQIILVTSKVDATRVEIGVWARNHGVSELAVPRQVVHMPEIPVLGTGKTDYLGVAKFVQQLPESRESPAISAPN